MNGAIVIFITWTTYGTWLLGDIADLEVGRIGPLAVLPM